ncbi:MAG: hypothetical protein FWE74_02105 [Oscillospiraceae bacterium]|nr:hypothetical protein [Oscillospiraceae bacterium]
MKSKKFLAVLIICILSMSIMSIPAGARLITNANDDGYYKAYAIEDLTAEDFLRVAGINWFIKPADASFGGVTVISSSLPGSNWLDTEFGDAGAGKPITATAVEGEDGVYRIRHWSRGASPTFEASLLEGEKYAQYVLGSYWGTFEVVRYEWLDSAGNVIQKKGAAAPELKPEPEPVEGKLGTADALIVLRVAAGLMEETDELLAKYDLNSDGELTTADAILILRAVAGV